LARALKFNCDETRSKTIEELKPIVRRWHALALPVIETKSFDLNWAEFIHAYEKARHALGGNIVDVAAERIDLNNLPAAAIGYEDETTRKLAGLCIAIAKLNDAKRFFLSTHDAAEKLGLKEAMQAWRLMRLLEHDRIIRCVETGNKRRAGRYEICEQEVVKRKRLPRDF
jgi:hypothetical protein